ncbi:MAG: CBS domain-containing protein [Planctomycetota bacterium]
MIAVTDVMSRAVATVGPTWTLAELAGFLADEKVLGAPVVDDAGKLVGVVSTTDLVAAIGDDGASYGSEPVFGVFDGAGRWEPLSARLSRERFENGDTKVADVMTTDPITATPDASVGEVAALLLEHGIHRLIITSDGLLRGIVTATDLLAALVAYGEREIASQV